MVASDGGVFAFGDAKFAGSCPGIGGCSGAAVAVMPDASGNGYWLVTQSGLVYPFGDAANYGGPGPQSVPVTSAVRTPDGRGYWVLFANGAISPTAMQLSTGTLVGCLAASTRPAPSLRRGAGLAIGWLQPVAPSTITGDVPNDGSMAGVRLNGSIIAATGW